MSIETGSPTAPASAASRPLPPALKFNAATHTFTGTAEPGKTVRLTGSDDQRMLTATADANGSWTLELRKPPRLYTTFEIWVCDGPEGESSDKVKFTYGGDNPKLSDIYASKTLAFGRSTPGTKVSAFGPEGQLLGRALALGEHGAWVIRFGNAVEAGDKICVLAEALSGNTSMPCFVEAKEFSLNDHNVGHIAGTGAEPGDQVELYDIAAGQVIASTIAAEDGRFEFSFCDPIEAGLRISVERIHRNGETSTGPVFTALRNQCLSPAIASFSGTTITGRADPGLKVTYTQLRDGNMVHSDTVTVPENGLWSSDAATEPYAFDFQKGDIIFATTQSADGTKESVFSSNVKVDGTRPGTPLVEKIDSDGANGWAEPFKFILASTAEDGVVALAQAGRDGYWQLGWKDFVGSLPTTTVVFFAAYDTLLENQKLPTSMITASFADLAGIKPAKPVIVKYMTTDIEGTQTPVPGYDLVVIVHNNTTRQDINPGGALVADGIWQVIPKSPLIPGDNDEIIATTWLTKNNILLTASDESVPKNVSSFVPPTPSVTKSYPDDIEGLELISKPANLTMTTIYIAPELDISHTPVANSGHLTGQTWTISPAPPRTAGEEMVAWAVTDAGAISGYRPFKINAAEKPLPPSIGNWSSEIITGSGVPGQTVKLTVNDGFAGSAVVDAESRSWKIDIGNKPPADTKLSATATDPKTGAESDPFYIVVDQPRATLKIDNSSVTTSGFSGTTTNLPQIILGWRVSDGLKVVDYPTNTASFNATYIADSNIKSGDFIRFVSQNDTGDPEACFSTYEGNQVS
ncbi:hypothetical protein K7H91_20740 [Martelella mediterranea]|uniref:Ig-like domain-containing protein n=1 Tax=Martelella mediterranea TaxID=293089 RepID=UPI001E56A2FE|nr:Ig-like domain-containing protein [Martelella mediterranea]MCD1636191.1 hypothetical protein [Martelella mediterranea]